MKKGLRGEATLEKKNKTQEMKEKLEYIGLNLDEIPKTLKLVEDLKFRPNSGFDEKNIDNIDLFHQKKYKYYYHQQID